MNKLVIITGASRGLGRAIAVAFAKSRKESERMHFVLSGRDALELRTTEQEIASAAASDRVTCMAIRSDLSDLSSLQSAATLLFDQEVAFDVQQVFFINNAGSLGPLSPIGSEQQTAARLVEAVNVNVTACCFLTSQFVQRVRGALYLPQAKESCVVNISSLAALKAFESWGIYCAGKAARDMFHQVLAEEAKKTPIRDSFRVLSYAPGPLDTDMQREIRTGAEVDQDQRAFFRQMHEAGQLVDANQSAEKLVRLLAEGGYENGQHVDYYDI